MLLIVCPCRASGDELADIELDEPRGVKRATGELILLQHRSSGSPVPGNGRL